MTVSQKILPLLALLALNACGEQKTAEAPPAPAASAVSEAAPSDQTAASQPADNRLGGNLAAKADDAAWLSYQCADGQTLDVRYYRDADGAAAQIRADGQTFTLPYNREGSNDDLTAFGNGEYTWTIDNQFQTDFYKEENGFWTRHEKQQVASEVMDVDNVLMKNCAPVR